MTTPSQVVTPTEQRFARAGWQKETFGKDAVVYTKPVSPSLSVPVVNARRISVGQVLLIGLGALAVGLIVSPAFRNWFEKTVSRALKP